MGSAGDTLSQSPPPLGFLRLLALQIIGKAANIITPLASVGGDPLKAYLLQTAGVPFSAGLASVVIARTMATMAQGIFVLVITMVTFFSLGLPWQLVQAVAIALVIRAILVGAFPLPNPWSFYKPPRVGPSVAA